MKTNIWIQILDEIGGIILDFWKMLRGQVASRTTWLMVLGFTAVYLSSGKVEAFQQLLAYLGLGATWVVKMGAQNVAGIIKGNGKNGIQAPIIPKNAPIIPQQGDSLTTPENLQNLKPVPPPFDVKEFEERVELRAANTYGGANDITRFFAASDLLGPLPLDPSDYRTAILFEAVANHGMKAYYEKFGFNYEDSVNHLKDDKKCPYYSVANMARQKGIDYWSMLIRVERALASAGFPVMNWAGLL